MLNPRDYTADLYAPLNHVIGDGFGDNALPHKLNVGWLDLFDSRRLAAYRALAAYRDNNRRYWLPAELWERTWQLGTDGGLRAVGRSPAESYREYGDAGVLVAMARSLVLGDEQTVQVEGAQPASSGPPGQDPTPPEARAVEFQDWLRDWADTVGLPGKVLEGEEHSIGDGDGVYALGWSDRTKRPWLRTYDPGMWFPDWSAIDSPAYKEWDDDEFPPVVHLAWEVERDRVTYVQRTTWRMVPLSAPRQTAWGTTTSWTCIYEQAEWRVDKLAQTATVYDLQGGTPLVAPVDLFVDFVPVVHVPNDTPGGRRFGRSLLLGIAQILDDLAGADTDLSVDAELVASPPALFKGTDGQPMQVGPGVQWNVPADASAQYVDTSRNLDALTKFNAGLQSRLAKNSRLGEVLLGLVKPNEVPSGYALRLGFASAEALLREMRVVRERKYALLLKMAARLAQQNSVLPAGETPKVRLLLGAAMPADRAAAVEEVVGLMALPHPPISVHTAVTMLQAAGLPIEDAHAEVDRVRQAAFAQAVQLVDATGDVQAARAFLGLKGEGPKPPAPQVQPPQPDQPPAPQPGGQGGQQGGGQQGGQQGGTGA